MPDFKSVLESVATGLPLFQEMSEKQKMAMAAGWRWADVAPALAKTREELGEVEDAIQSGNKQDIVEELGDLIFMSTILCHYVGVDPDDALRAVIKKHCARFGYVERKAHEAGLTVATVPHELERRWYNEFKQSEMKRA